MNFLKKLGSVFSAAGSKVEANSYLITVQCNRCGEIIEARVNLSNELSIDYADDGKTTYYCRKVLMGAQHCFQKVEVELRFDPERNLMDKQINGGKFVDM